MVPLVAKRCSPRGFRFASLAAVVACTLGSLVFVGCDSSAPADPSSASLEARDVESELRASFAERLKAEIAAQENPWVLAHAILAFGPEVSVQPEGSGSESVSAVARLATRWVERENGRVFVALEGAGELGEQHPHLVLKTLIEVAAEHEIAQPLIRDLMRTATAEYVLPETFEQKNDVAWFLEALLRSGFEPDSPIRPGGPTPRELTRVALDVVEAGDALVEKQLSASEFSRPGGGGKPATEGVYAYTCSGQHLLQSLLAAAEHGATSPGDRARLAKRLDVYLLRLEAEYQFRQREYRRALDSGAPEILSAQMAAMFSLKLVGHGLEILGRAHRIGLGDRAKVEAAVRSTRRKLLGILRRLDEDLDPDRTLLERLRRSKPGMWQLWFGDGCHALRGLSETDAIGR